MPEQLRRLPMFPLGTVVFPGGHLPLHVFEARYRALVAECLASGSGFGVVLITRGSEVGGGDQRVDVGTEVRIEAAQPLEDGRWALLARGVGRIEVAQWLEDAPYPCAMVRDRHDAGLAVAPDTARRAGAAIARVRALAEELGHALVGPAPGSDASGTDGLWRLCDAVPFGAFDRQRLLEAPDPRARGELLVSLAEALGDDLAAMLR